MGTFVFKLPDVGEGITESEIAQWRVAVGDAVEEDQPLVDMLTDKAAVEIPSPVSGVVRELKGQAGDKVPVGGVLVVIEVSGAPSEIPSPAPAGELRLREEPRPRSGRERVPVTPGTLSPNPSPAVAGEGSKAKVAAAPTVRKRARELGLDLASVKGTGPSGRILHDDLDRHAAAPSSARTEARPASATDDDAVEKIRVIGLRRKIAEAMQASARRIPHFAYVEEVDVTELERLRRHLNETRAERGKLTLLPFLVRALVQAIPAFPQVNATYDDEDGIVTRHRALHAGIATATPNGLVVPVVRHAQRLDPWQCAAEIKRLSAAARDGRARREELTGSTITITSLGALGGIVTTPIINAPEVAIIGVNKMVDRPVVRDGQVVVRSMMNLSSSFDHRIVDGHDAASFIQRVKGFLEHPATLYLPG